MIFTDCRGIAGKICKYYRVFPSDIAENPWRVPEIPVNICSVCTRSDTGIYFILIFFTVTEREALEESKANFVELQKIAVNKREVTEEKKKAYELAEKEALEAQNNVKAAEEKISRQTYSKLLNLLLA